MWNTSDKNCKIFVVCGEKNIADSILDDIDNKLYILKGKINDGKLNIKKAEKLWKEHLKTFYFDVNENIHFDLNLKFRISENICL